MVLKNKQILTATLVVALGAAVAVNWYYTNTPELHENGELTTLEVSGNLGDSLYVGATAVSDTTKADETTEPENSNDYFAEAKLRRKQSHDEIIDSIEEIVENIDKDSSASNQISVMLSDFKSDIKAESDAENLIKAKIGGECLVIINDGACQVILKENTLNDLLILQITEIIEKNTEISSENLTIIEAK